MSFKSFHIETLDLPPRYKAICRQTGFSTAAEFMLAKPIERSRKFRRLRIVDVQISEIEKGIARALAPKSVRLTAAPKTHTIKTGDNGIDTLLHGGVRTKSLTEVVGESGSGKSHLTLVLALAAQHPLLCSNPGGAIVISSERVLETSRLVELSKLMRAKYPGPSIKHLLDNIQSSRVADIDALHHTLTFVLPHMLQTARDAAATGTNDGETPALPVRLVVIDSLTALLRGEYANTAAGLGLRSQHMSVVADKLRALATEFDIAVVVVNQVQDVFDRRPRPRWRQHPHDPNRRVEVPPPLMRYSTQLGYFSGASPGVKKEAALGVVWANVVNTRIMLSRTGRRRMLSANEVVGWKRRRIGPARDLPSVPKATTTPIEKTEAAFQLALEKDKPTLLRRMFLVFSPTASPGMLDYIITPSGIHSMAGSFEPVDLEDATRIRNARIRMLWAGYSAKVRAARARRRGKKALTHPAAAPATQDGDGEFDEVYDDLGDLPLEFWKGVDKLSNVAEPLAVGVVD